jgi:2-dehydropantoate 2-reductase
MLTDILRGGPTEIDAINGMLVQYGEQVGVTTPLNRTLWALVRSKEKVRRSDLKALEQQLNK